MPTAPAATSSRRLRLWPGVSAALLLVVVRLVAPLVAPDAGAIGVLAGIVGALIIILWWLFFSKAPWPERIGAILLMIVAVLATSRVVDRSIATGMMGMMLAIFAMPVLAVTLVVWAAVTGGLSDRARRATLVFSILLA